MSVSVTSTSPLRAWTTSDRQLLNYTEWVPLQCPKAVLIAVHGLSGSANDFEPLGLALATRGYAVQAMELRSQGNDPVRARRGDLEEEILWRRDLKEFFYRTREGFPDSPVYFYGESLGAVILIDYASHITEHLDVPFGMILSSPVVNFRNAPSPFKMRIFQLLYQYLPKYRINLSWFVGVRPKTSPPLCRDEEYQAELHQAPHRIQTYSLRFLKAVYSLISSCMQKAPQVHIPTLIVHAGQDIFIKKEQTEAFFQALSSVDKESVLFPEAYHLLLRDPNRDDVLTTVLSWLEARVALMPPPPPAKTAAKRR